MISVVIPVYNAEKFIEEVLDSIMGQSKLPDEIILVDDGSKDHSLELMRRYPKKKNLPKKTRYKVIHQKNKGHAGASNTAIKASKGGIIIHVDSDAILDRDFIDKVVKEIKKDKKMGAVAGYIGTANPENFWARMMGYDLEYRYDHIGGRKKKKVLVDHVSPNNTAYRREVFKKTGWFSSKYQYAQDIDFSYRMLEKGFKIGLLKNTGCVHYWRESFWGYTKQQFNVSYWRLKFIGRNPSKVKGDKVAGMRMFMQAPMTGLIILLYILYGLGFLANMWYIPTLLLGILMIERLEESSYLLWKKKSLSMLLMPIVHLWRNIVWGAAIAYFILKR